MHSFACLPSCESVLWVWTPSVSVSSCGEAVFRLVGLVGQDCLPAVPRAEVTAVLRSLAGVWLIYRLLALVSPPPRNPPVQVSEGMHARRQARTSPRLNLRYQLNHQVHSHSNPPAAARSKQMWSNNKPHTHAGAKIDING